MTGAVRNGDAERVIVPTLCVGMPPGTLRVPLSTHDRAVRNGDAERHRMHSFAARGNDQVKRIDPRSNAFVLACRA